MHQLKTHQTSLVEAIRTHKHTHTHTDKKAGKQGSDKMDNLSALPHLTGCLTLKVQRFD